MPAPIPSWPATRSRSASGRSARSLQFQSIQDWAGNIRTVVSKVIVHEPGMPASRSSAGAIRTRG